jgi:hypothetical protein
MQGRGIAELTLRDGWDVTFAGAFSDGDCITLCELGPPYFQAS